MDNIFEILVPLVIAAVYFFGNMFSGKAEEDGPPPALPRQRGADEPGDDVDAIERQRRVQEEIRRKIMERRRDAGNAPVAPASPERRRDVEPAREIRGAQKKTRELVHETRDRRSPSAELGREVGKPSTPPAFSWGDSDNAYDSAIEAQLKRIEATKRQAAKLQQQTALRGKNSPTAAPAQFQPADVLSGTVRSSLLDPRAARVAFIYGEVLGPPVALRRGPGNVPGLSGPG